MSEILLVNPRRRRRSVKKRVTRRRRTVARKRNPVRRVRRRTVAKRRSVRRRRNPIVSTRNIKSQVMTASTGALGALSLDVALAYIPLPAAITGGIIGKVTKGAAAIGLGIVANKFLGVSAANANRMAEGALTVQLHGIGKELLGQFAPGVAMSAYMDEGLGYYGSGWNPNAEIEGNSPMGTYLPDISADPMGIDSRNLGAYVDAGLVEENGY